MSELATAAGALLEAFDAYDRALQRWGTLGKQGVQSSELDRLYGRMVDAAHQLAAVLNAAS
jgi:hypothetical protein